MWKIVAVLGALGLVVALAMRRDEPDKPEDPTLPPVPFPPSEVVRAPAVLMKPSLKFRSL